MMGSRGSSQKMVSARGA